MRRLKNAWSQLRGKIPRAEWILVATTIGYVVVSYLQWQAMITSNDLTRKALDANERAWVIGSIHDPKTDAKGHFFFPFTLKNVGKSPAFHVKVSPAFTFDESPPDQSRIDLGGSDALLGPGEAEQGVTDLAPELESAIRANRSFYVWILVRYSDPFAPKRFTRECFQYVPPVGRGWRVCSKDIVHE